ncbi:MAG: L,D-transpeptidase, partial [Nanoarchaeota archaeon]
FHELKTDGKVNILTTELLNKSFEEYAFSGVKRVLEERVFHAKCNDCHPYVIEQKELDQLVDSAAEQLNLHTLEGVQRFFSEKHESANVHLDIPELYQQDFMKLEIEVEKWEKNRIKSKIRLYAVENEERAELFQTKVVVGGKIKNKKTGRKEEKNTPEKEFYIKNILLMPLWNPKLEVQKQEEVKEEEMLPGPFNAFGMMLAPLYANNKPQKNPFSQVQEGYEGYGIHLTAWPSSVENSGTSHGCIRIHPKQSRFFYFLAGYTPHKNIFESFEGRGSLKFTPSRGSSIPLDPEYYIKVKICEKECE